LCGAGQLGRPARPGWPFGLWLAELRMHRVFPGIIARVAARMAIQVAQGDLNCRPCTLFFF